MTSHTHSDHVSHVFVREVPAVFSFSLIYVVFTHFLFPENILAVIVATRRPQRCLASLLMAADQSNGVYQVFCQRQKKNVIYKIYKKMETKQ